MFTKDETSENFKNEKLEITENELNELMQFLEIIAEMALKKYENLKRVTKLLYQSGVPMMTGTDAINPYSYPGYSLHREFELLKDCGIPDDEILKMATLNAAGFLNLKDYGQVKPGFVASLVLLNENPLLDIRNSIKINAVVLNGEIFDSEALKKLVE